MDGSLRTGVICLREAWQEVETLVKDFTVSQTGITLKAPQLRFKKSKNGPGGGGTRL